MHFAPPPMYNSVDFRLIPAFPLTPSPLPSIPRSLLTVPNLTYASPLLQNRAIFVRWYRLKSHHLNESQTRLAKLQVESETSSFEISELKAIATRRGNSIFPARHIHSLLAKSNENLFWTAPRYIDPWLGSRVEMSFSCFTSSSGRCRNQKLLLTMKTER